MFRSSPWAMRWRPVAKPGKRELWIPSQGSGIGQRTFPASTTSLYAKYAGFGG